MFDHNTCGGTRGHNNLRRNMRKPLTTLCLILGFMCPFNKSVSVFLQDLDGSGSDLDGSGSDLDSTGSLLGNRSKPGDINITNVHHNSTPTIKVGSETQSALEDSSHQPFDSSYWLRRDAEFVVLSNSKGFLQYEEVYTAVVSGSVAGVTLAVILGVIYIYKIRRKETEDTF